MCLKLQAVKLFYAGKSRDKIVSYLKVSRTRVDKWISRYLSQGLTEGGREKAHRQNARLSLNSN
jgi:transposase